MSSKEEVRRIAKLARLRIEDSELETIQNKFSSILDHFKFLSEADTQGIEPLFHATERMELRPDLPEAPIDREALLANAPDAFENLYRIPRVVGGEE